jgi:hypothetical protein
MKRNRYATQGRLIIEQLKRRPMTYMQMLALGVSVCPWKRVKETISLMPGWDISYGQDTRGRLTWRAVLLKGKGKKACTQK